MAEVLRAPTVVVRGHVSNGAVAYARDKLLALLADAPGSVLDVELRLDHHEDPARERPAHVEMTVDVNGSIVRARRSAPTMTEAVDGTLARLRRRIEAAAERPQALLLRHRDPQSWHHDDVPTPRPRSFPRPVEERSLVRRKTFSLKPESIEEALFDLEALDHDFFLFVHDDTGSEAVVYRADGGYGVQQRVATPDAVARAEVPLATGPPPGTTSLADALGLLDETDAPFVFFVDEASGRGQVVYRRYDGNAGLVHPA